MRKTSERTSIKTEKTSRLASCLFPIDVSVFTPVIILLSLLVNYYPYLFIHYLLAFIHELSHVVVALLFKTKIKRLKFLPFGFYALMEDFEHKRSYQQFLILIAGPLSYFLSFFILKSMYLGDILSFYSYRAAMNSNLFIALFNLIPFYPLDGARIVEIPLACFLSEKRTRLGRLFLSFLALVFIIFISIKHYQYPIMFYLSATYLVELVLWRKSYRLFLIQRLYVRKPRGKKVTGKDEIFRYQETIKITKKGFKSENEIIKTLLRRLKSTKKYLKRTK